MARLIFPSEREVRLSSPYRGSAFVSAAGLTATVYSDSAGTVLADVQNYDTTANPTATFTIDADSLLPLFLGPASGADSLYVKVNNSGATVHPIYALETSDLSAAVAAEAAARAAAVSAHEADTTNVHGITDTTALLTTAAAPELIRDTIGTALVAGTNITITPNDPADTITIAASGGSLQTKDEGSTVVAATTALNFVGAGVTASDGGSGTATVTIPGAAPVWNTVSKTTTYTAAASDEVLASASGGAWALTLPAVSNGVRVRVKKTDNSVNAVTITPASGTVDGAATRPVITQYEAIEVVSDGTNWFIV